MAAEIDLHLHSNESDGTYSPEEVVNVAHKLGLKGIALTDHDTMAGCDRARQAANNKRLSFLSGLEISVLYPGYNLHILGYTIDSKHPVLQNMLTKLRQHREVRNPQIIHKLNKIGVNITYKEVQASTASTVIGRPHIASIIVEKGYAPSKKQAFQQYLTDDSPAFVAKEIIPPEEACQTILAAGGLPVLAHPWQSRKKISIQEIEQLLIKMIPLGLKGLEVYYPGLIRTQITQLRDLAKHYKLYITGGSDFHGSNRPDVNIGDAAVPAKLLKQFGVK